MISKDKSNRTLFGRSLIYFAVWMMSLVYSPLGGEELAGKCSQHPSQV